MSGPERYSRGEEKFPVLGQTCPLHAYVRFCALQSRTSSRIFLAVEQGFRFVRKVLSIIAAVAATGLSAPALASDIIWLDSDHTAFSGDYASGASLTFTGGGVTVKATAWTIKSDGKIYRAQLGVWDQGLGVRTGTSDNSHTIDNSGSKDFVLFQFDKVVELDFASLQTGWHNMSDTDATIGYNMNANVFGANPTLNGLSQSTLSVMNLYDSESYGNSGDSYRDINPAGYDGKLWLIGATFTNPEGTYKLDGFKIEKLTFTKIPPPPPPGGVPEPSTWAMMLLGFFGLGGAMRSARKKSAGLESGNLSEA
jgi:hypothetical protein